MLLLLVLLCVVIDGGVYVVDIDRFFVFVVYDAGIRDAVVGIT